jgi:hypothetical protein
METARNLGATGGYSVCERVHADELCASICVCMYGGEGKGGTLGG